MSSHTKIDTLIASLYPHVAPGFCGDIIHAGSSLRPSKANSALYDIVDSFAILFGHHPGCDAAAVTIQAAPSRTAELYVCPSPIVPDHFEYNVKRWVDQVISIRKECTERSPDGKLSASMQGFILETYHLCSEAMHQRRQEFGMWEVLAGFETSDVPDSNAVAGLRRVSDLVTRFLESKSNFPLKNDGDTLQFHELCLSLCDLLQAKETMEQVEQYMYPQGVDRILVYLSLSKAISTLLSAPSQDPFHDECSTIVLKPSLCARQFSATVTTAHIAACFGEVTGIDWEDVVRAFNEVAETEDVGKGLQWDAEKNLLSTADVVTAHPEITLLQYLIEKGDVKGERYIACSRLPCYASVRYLDAVNQTIRPTRAVFTMCTTNPDWCQLAEAEPWILPDGTNQEVAAKMAQVLLRDLSWLVDHWKNNPLNGVANRYDDSEEDDEDEEE